MASYEHQRWKTRSHCRAVASSENPGGLVVLGGENVPPLAEIGLTDLPKSGGTMAPPAPSGTTPLTYVPRYIFLLLGPFENTPRLLFWAKRRKSILKLLILYFKVFQSLCTKAKKRQTVWHFNKKGLEARKRTYLGFQTPYYVIYEKNYPSQHIIFHFSIWNGINDHHSKY